MCSSKSQPQTSHISTRLQSSTTERWCNLIQFYALASFQQQQMTHLDHFHRPTTYNKEAATSSHWVPVIQAESNALQANNT